MVIPRLLAVSLVTYFTSHLRALVPSLVCLELKLNAVQDEEKLTGTICSKMILLLAVNQAAT